MALLSFSTYGSARHPNIDKTLGVLEGVRLKDPTLHVDGELQFDAAYVPSIGKMKAPSSTVAGQANVMIFPDLQSGNIAYKIAERMGGFDAIGPLL